MRVGGRNKGTPCFVERDEIPLEVELDHFHIAQGHADVICVVGNSEERTKTNFVFRTLGTVERTFIYPIVYELMKELK